MRDLRWFHQVLGLQFLLAVGGNLKKGFFNQVQDLCVVHFKLLETAVQLARQHRAFRATPHPFGHVARKLNPVCGTR